MRIFVLTQTRPIPGNFAEVPGWLARYFRIFSLYFLHCLGDEAAHSLGGFLLHLPGHVGVGVQRVNADQKMPIFAEMECHFSAVSIAVYTALIHHFTCRLEARQALIYQLALGLTGENGKRHGVSARELRLPIDAGYDAMDLEELIHDDHYRENRIREIMADFGVY